MGGLGSGNRHRFGKKTTTDECHSLNVRSLHRDGLLKPGTSFRSSWSRFGKEMASIGGFVYGDRVVLSYRHHNRMNGEWEDVEQTVGLSWTPCNFGGERPWFICPGVVNGERCGRRVAILYGPGRLARGAGDQCLGEDRVAGAHARVGGDDGVCRLGTDSESAVGQCFDLLQGQTADINQMGRPLDLELHQIEQIGAAADELGSGLEAAASAAAGSVARS